MELIINQVHKLLIKNKKTLAVAESCTGGLLSYLLTSISGSSKYFILGLVVYSNRVKTSMLNIPASLILQRGTVSEEVARKMSEKIKKLAKTDFGIGITGIAGPSGSTRNKPVGTVFIAVDGKKQKTCQRFQFQGSRQTIRKAAVSKALELLKSLIIKEDQG
jgi:nicotinamide-nucleotide amidase